MPAISPAFDCVPEEYCVALASADEFADTLAGLQHDNSDEEQSVPAVRQYCEIKGDV